MQNSLATKYNKYIIFAFVIAPFIGFITYTYLDMDLNKILQFLSFIGVFLLFIFKPPNTKIRFPKYIIFYILFTAFTFFSAFVLLDREFKISYLYSNTLIGAINMMIIIENLKINRKYFSLIMKTSIYVLIIAFITILIQQVVNSSFFVKPIKLELYEVKNEFESRLPSIYSWSFELSKGFGYVSIFLIVVEYLYKRKKNILIWIFMGLVYAFLTKARWIMVNIILVFVVLIIHHENKFKQFLKFAILVPILVVSSYFVLNAIGINTDRIVEDRVKSNSASSRILAFAAFDKLFMDNPVLGVGNIKYGMGGTGKQDYKLRSFLQGQSSQMHVGYLSLFYMYGFVGGLLFLSFLYFLLRKLYIDAKETKMWGSFLALLSFALANLTLVWFGLFEMGMIFALVINKYYIDQLKFQQAQKRITKTNIIEYF